MKWLFDLAGFTALFAAIIFIPSFFTPKIEPIQMSKGALQVQEQLKTLNDDEQEQIVSDYYDRQPKEERDLDTEP